MMAIYIPIKKEQEDDLSVVYAYGCEQINVIAPASDQRKQRFVVSYAWGSFRFEKKSGEVELMRLADGDIGHQQFSRAVVKVTQHWKKGVFPEETCFAA